MQDSIINNCNSIFKNEENTKIIKNNSNYAILNTLNNDKSYPLLETIKEYDKDCDSYVYKYNYNTLFKERQISLNKNKNKKYINF